MPNPNDPPDLPAQVVSERTHLQVPSYPHWIEGTVEFLRQKAILSGACQETRAGKVMLALHEALSNAIVHGNLELSSDLKEKGDDTFAKALARRVADPAYSERTVEVLVDSSVERCRWVVTDQGKGFNIDAILERFQSDDPEVMLSSGRGILIMRSFLDDVRYEQGGRRLVLTLLRESGAEKRHRPRVASNQTLQVAPILADGTIDWDAAYQAVSKNFSEQGIGILQERLAESGRVLIGISVGGRVHYVPAEVRHCRSLGGDVVELGCRFQGRDEPPPLTPEQPVHIEEVQQAVHNLLEGHLGPQRPADDRRVHPRVIFSEKIEVQSAGQTKAIAGFARDLSKGGIAFITTVLVPLKPATIYLPQSDGSTLKLGAEVVRCVKIQDGFYDAGARFLNLEPGKAAS